MAVDISDRILIVDDERLVQQLLTRALQPKGYTCMTAGTLAEARQRLDESEAALVLCDVDLPDGSGLDFAAGVLDRFPRTAVVVMSGIGHGEAAARSFAYGIDHYLIKPFSLADAVDCIERALSRRPPNAHAG